MKYEEPIMEILKLENMEVTTLASGGEFTDETLEIPEDGSWI